jgi:uncharacterized membrane protein (UPF0182 family)
MREGLEEALAALFGGPERRPPAAAAGADAAEPDLPDTTGQALIAEAWRRYQAALQAQRDIDWARYGEEFRRLGELLERLGGEGAAPER